AITRKSSGGGGAGVSALLMTAPARGAAAGAADRAIWGNFMALVLDFNSGHAYHRIGLGWLLSASPPWRRRKPLPSRRTTSRRSGRRGCTVWWRCWARGSRRGPV